MQGVTCVVKPQSHERCGFFLRVYFVFYTTTQSRAACAPSADYSYDQRPASMQAAM